MGRGKVDVVTALEHRDPLPAPTLAHPQGPHFRG